MSLEAEEVILEVQYDDEEVGRAQPRRLSPERKCLVVFIQRFTRGRKALESIELISRNFWEWR